MRSEDRKRVEEDNKEKKEGEEEKERGKRKRRGERERRRQQRGEEKDCLPDDLVNKEVSNSICGSPR